MRPIHMEDYEMHRIVLSQDQIWEAIRQYIKHKSVPPWDASVKFDETKLQDIEKLTIEWSSCAVVDP